MKTHTNKILLMTLVLMVITTQLVAQINSFSLQDCIDYAWENSTDIGRASNTIKSASSYLEQSRAALGPNLSLNISQNASSTNSYLGTGSNGDWNRDSNMGLNLSLSSSITLYNGAKLRNTIKQNKTNLAAAETDIQTQKELISLDILTAYINVLLANEQVKNNEAQLKSTVKQLEYAQVRKSAGIISTADYLNIKSQSASEKASLVSAQSKHRLNLVSLMQLMNMPVDESFNILEPNIQALLNDSLVTDADKVYNIALGIRPDIKTADLDLQSALMGIKIAKANALPTLSLNGSLGTGYSDNLSGINLGEQMSNKISPAIGLSLSIPIYQRKQVKNQVTQATIQADNFQYNLMDIKNNLRKAIEQACTDANTADMTFQALLGTISGRTGILSTG